ncbi:hypothetical protein C8N24_0316 [Solirubrobacter pauli]|uniref:Uncharacterized protein n=1 Tax=Solirubrobacter pauli TaxID=166793 RepID=A0A660LCU5_9ACTN|nr:hypothetical protein [Solirubrobacter pauli]RKQ90511.1 hypothetical protein C8N24_0316 [Solirubrobacter pauli]
MGAHANRCARVAELRAAYRHRRLTVDHAPATRITRPIEGAIAFDTTAVASAVLSALTPLAGRPA